VVLSSAFPSRLLSAFPRRHACAPGQPWSRLYNPSPAVLMRRCWHRKSKFAVKTLALFRHAKSDWSDARARDFDRPLNERGQRGALAMGEHVRDSGRRFDRVIASPAVRVAKPSNGRARRGTACSRWNGTGASTSPVRPR
jgi:hypothetical protein